MSVINAIDLGAVDLSLDFVLVRGVAAWVLGIDVCALHLLCVLAAMCFRCPVFVHVGVCIVLFLFATAYVIFLFARGRAMSAHTGRRISV
jgi:hypothetical protein